MCGKAGKGTQEGKGNAKFFTALIYVFLLTDLVLFFSCIYKKYLP